MNASVFIGFGSNIGDRLSHLVHGVALLARHPLLDLILLSSIYETEPVGNTEQPDFLNGVAGFATAMTAREVLDLCLLVEKQCGRERRERWGPRTIDLDLLLYGEAIIEEEGLSVPHPRLAERRFVLLPLQEIAPEMRIPGSGRTVRELAGATADRSRVRRVLTSSRLLNLISEA